MRNISLEKSYIEYGGETSPRSFYVKLKWSTSLGQCFKDLCSLL